MDLPKNPPPDPGPGVQPGNPVNVELPRKPGRPPGSGKHYTKAELAARGGTNQPPPKTGANRTEPPVEIDADLVADCIVNLYEIGDDVWVRFIFKAAQGRIPKERVSQFQAELNGIKFNERDRVAVKKAVAALVRKYKFLQLWGPELVLFIHFAQYNYRMYSFARAMAALPLLSGSPVPKKEETPNGTDEARDSKQGETPPVRR